MQEGQKFAWEAEFCKCVEAITRAGSIYVARKAATAFLDDTPWGDQWPLHDQVIQCLRERNLPIPSQNVDDDDDEATNEWMEYVAEVIYNSLLAKGKEEEVIQILDQIRPNLQEFLKEACQLGSDQLVQCIQKYMESQNEETIRAEMTLLYPDMMKQRDISNVSVQTVLLIFLVGAKCNTQPNKNDEGEKEKKKKAGEKRARQEEEEEDEEDEEVEDMGHFLADLHARCNANNNNNNHVMQPETTKEAYLANLKATDKELGSRLTVGKALVRGAFIAAKLEEYKAAKKKQEDAWRSIGTELGSKAKRPRTSDVLTVPKAVYELVVKTGLHMLRHLEPREKELKELMKKQKAIEAYVKNNPNVCDAWQEQPTMTPFGEVSQQWLFKKSK